MAKPSHCHPAAAPALARFEGLQPDWPAPAHVHALCTTRAGGVSAGAFASLNLGTHVGDAQSAVVRNRMRLQATVQATTPGARAVFLNQVHGRRAAILTPDAPDGERADAALTTQPGLACTIMVADCLPVLITDRQGRIVAAAHAGWRGLAGGVLESVLQYFRAFGQVPYENAAMKIEANDAEADPVELLAWLGPCIGPKAFEVGEEVRDAFCAADGAAEQHFAPQGGAKWLANLPGLARQRLAAQGVTQLFGNDGSDAWCTFSQPSRFFSHRRDASASGGTGRMAACIWLG